MPELSSSMVRDHLRLLLFFTITSRVISYLVLFFSTFLPLFDSSPKTVTQSRWSSPLLRWDAFHFAHIAEKGYVYEYEWAFLPGVPLLMRFSAQCLRYIGRFDDSLTWDNFFMSGALAALACDTSSTLYHLSLHHLRSPNLAFLASLLSLFPSSPPTLRFAAYSEPFFTYLSYKGILCCARSQWFLASSLFALAGTFRSNGILLSGFILWGMIVEPFLNGYKPSFKTLLYSVLLTAITFTPFVHHNYSAYVAFCTTAHPASWCINIPPSIYTHVQSTYWNVGFLRYWTLQQLPNFIISAPPLILLFSFSIYHITNALIPRILLIKNSSNPTSTIQPVVPKQPRSPFLSPTLTPHGIHALILCTTILLASHTQIILRIGPSMPITYWAAAWLLIEQPRWRRGVRKSRAENSKGVQKSNWPSSMWGKWWVGWSVVWGAVSLVLWGTFLPPA